LHSAAHVLVVWALLELSWAFLTDWAGITLEPLGSLIRASWPDVTFGIISVRDHVVIALDAVSSVLNVPNVVGWHWIALCDAIRAVIVDIGVGWAVNSQLSVAVEFLEESWVTSIFLALSWEANFTSSSIAIIEDWSWVFTSWACNAETVFIDNLEFSW
jgi:hypothetical protein